MAKEGSTAKPARVNIQIKDYLPEGEQPELPGSGAVTVWAR